jgi:hypothetical protein
VLIRLRDACAMDRGTALFPVYSSSGVARSIRDAFAEVAALLFGSAPFGTRAAIDAEIFVAVEPHMAILLHKKAKYGAERWAKEIEDFVARAFFWPEPAATDVFGRMDRRQIAQMVDRIVAEEQQRAASKPMELPQTSRFGSSWAD